MKLYFPLSKSSLCVTYSSTYIFLILFISLTSFFVYTQAGPVYFSGRNGETPLGTTAQPVHKEREGKNTFIAGGRTNVEN